MKRLKLLKRALTFVLGLSLTVTAAAADPVPVQAQTKAQLEAYLNRCENSIQNISYMKPKLKVIADAYLAGTDNVAAPSWDASKMERHFLYAVDPGTEIQGNVYDSRYYPQDNMEYLKDILQNYGQSLAHSNLIYTAPKGAQYIEREGCRFAVVACDEKWVTVYDPGYQSWNRYYTQDGQVLSGACQNAADVYMESHPAGFYKIERNKVWLDFGRKENHPYSSQKDIPKAGTGVVTKLAELLPVPNEKDETYTAVYALPRGAELTVVSEKKVPSEAPGSTNSYYKVAFNGSEKYQNNGVNYLAYTVPGMYYIDSRYLNVTKAGEKEPKGAVLGEVSNVSGGLAVYAYESKSTESAQIGILSKGASVYTLPSESDATWTTVIFSGQKCYVQTKYIVGKVTDISKLRIADIVNDQFVMKWDPGANNVDYSFRLTACSDYSETTLWSKDHYKSNSVTIPRKYLEKANNYYLKFYVQANGGNGKKGKEKSIKFDHPGQGKNVLYDRSLAPGKSSIKVVYAIRCLQYSTNKNFKNAKTVVNTKKKNGKVSYEYVKTIKNLKPNTTYYVRARHMTEYKTAAGKKWAGGKWSTKVLKIRTLK